MKNLISILCLLLICSYLRGQVSYSVTADKDSVGIGDPISLTYRVSSMGDPIDVIDFSRLFSMENMVYNVDTNMMDKTADVGILSGGNLNISESSPSASTQGLWVQSGPKQSLETTISIAIYNIGLFSLEPAKSLASNEKNTIPLEPTFIMVSPPEGMQDSLSLAPIKPIIEEPVVWQDYLPYLYTVSGIVALLLLGWFLFKKQKGAQKLEVSLIEVKPAPDVIAIQKLNALREQELWERGEIKAYQSQLTYIIREYLEGRFDITALELTTGEILLELNSKDFDPIHSKNLENILQIADLIKFAKARPTEDLHSKFMEMAFDFVNDTKKSITDSDS